MHDIAPPSSLIAMQRWFAKILTSPILASDVSHIPLYPPQLIEEISQKIAPSPTLKSEERMGIYQQQYWWRLISVMQDLFPSLVALLDYTEFNRTIAEPYLSRFPPHDWFISHIGADLPQWLANDPLKKALAQLDLAYEELLFANILPPAAPAPDQTLYLQPSVLLFELDSDLFSFRHELIRTRSLPKLKKFRKKRFFVLYRHNEENHHEAIDPPLFALLSRLQKGATLNELAPLLEQCGDIFSLFKTMSARKWLTVSSR